MTQEQAFEQEEILILRGFDNCRIEQESDEHFISIRCSQCEALVINGTACHETGCLNLLEERDCLECGTEFIEQERGQKLCSETCAAIYYGWYTEPDPDESECEDLF